MAKNYTVWGIDIGNTSLKALRCRRGAEPGTVEALSFDFIEHSKILTQAGADPMELITESLTTFLSRNSVKKDRVAVTVTGQNTISRFLKLPPFDKKKLKDIIRYEAKQWLPFALEDVVWDYQPLAGGSMQGNTMVDTEVGMFAIKREHTAKILAPFDKAGIPVDCIQSSPVTLYNFTAFDQMNFEELTANYDPKNPSEYTIILCPGTDSTDVVITNGIKIWVRNFNVGGNNFTKALTRGLKLTFSNAEHIKREAATSQDPKAVFQAMRPVFNEFLTEVNRSVEFYSSLDRRARYSRMILLGNPGKLPGLREFLRQNLGYEIVRLTKFNKLVGDDVITAPAFVDNLGTFAGSYGLALQLLNESVISTNLIPMDVVKDRLINSKRPWLLAGAAALMLGLVVQYSGASTAFNSINDTTMKSAESAADAVTKKSGDLKSRKDTAVSEYEKFNTIGSTLTSNVEGRIIWLEVLKAINASLPRRENETSTTKLEEQQRIYVSSIEFQDVTELKEWWEAAIKSPGAYVPDPEEWAIIAREKEGEASNTASEDSGTSASGASSDGSASGEILSDTDLLRLNEIPAPEGPGKIVQLTLYHYHNPMDASSLEIGAEYVRRTLCRNLKFGAIPLPVSLDTQLKAASVGQTEMVEVSFREMGISHPVVLDYTKPLQQTIIDPAALQKLIIDQTLKMQTTTNKGTRGGAAGRMGGVGSMGMMGGDSMGMVDMMDTPGMSTMIPGMTGLGMGGGNPISMLGGMPGTGGGGSSRGGLSAGGAGQGLDQQMAGIPDDQKLKIARFDCVVQFVWVPTPPSVREKKREELRLAQEAEAQAKAAETADTASAEEETETVTPDTGGPSGVPDGTSVDNNNTEPDAVSPAPETPTAF
ncbi:MAG: type IV pilus assembly protein PilM [Planctomycetaceae bacterium]|jgi:type IV pilus assembly protein PilM|nr:type IV pilus assembly protein PilM [Planctomycetaceae bacterium]